MTDVSDTDATAEDDLPRRQKLALALVAMIVFTAYGSVLPVFGMRIREYFSLTAEQFGDLVGLHNLGRIPALLLVGPVIGLCGVRRVAELSLVGIGASFVDIGIGASLLAFQLGLDVQRFF